MTTPTFCLSCRAAHAPRALVTCDGCSKALCPETARVESGWHLVDRPGSRGPRICGRIHRSDVRGDLVVAGRS